MSINERSSDGRIKFTLDDDGQTTGFTMEGAAPEPMTYVAQD